MYMLRSSVKNKKMLNNILKYALKHRFQETAVHVPLYDPLKIKIFGLWTIYPSSVTVITLDNILGV